MSSLPLLRVLVVRALLGAENGQMPVPELLAIGPAGQVEQILGGLSKKAQVITVTGPTPWRRGHFALDLSQAVATVTDEPGLRAVLRMWQPTRMTTPNPGLRLVRETRDGAA